MIYLDNAATTLKKPACVAEAVYEAMNHMGNAGRGASRASLAAGRSIYEARRILADFFGAEDSSRIVFTMNSTEALNIAIQGILEAGDHAVTTDAEHNSVLRPLYERERAGVTFSVAETDEKGLVIPEALEALIRPETKAIICAHGSNLTGNVTDLSAVGAIARRHGLLFIVDASQTAGVIPIDVQRLGIDILCFTGHKSLMGPQGTGGMYVRTGVEVRPLLFGGTGVQSFLKTQPEEMPTRLEAGTLNGHGIAGLAAAAEYISGVGLDGIYEREHALMSLFYEGVKDIPGIRILGDFTEDRKRCPVVSLNVGDLDSAEVSDWLMEEYDIATRAGAHCAPLMHRHFGTEKQGAVRFSFSWFNTEDEVNEAVRAVKEIALTAGKED